MQDERDQESIKANFSPDQHFELAYYWTDHWFLTSVCSVYVGKLGSFQTRRYWCAICMISFLMLLLLTGSSQCRLGIESLHQ